MMVRRGLEILDILFADENLTTFSYKLEVITQFKLIT
jgi:hypothetical protein